MVVAVTFATSGSIALAGDSKADEALEHARAKVDDATDRTASSAKKLGSKVKRNSKKMAKDTGTAVRKTGDKIEDAAK